MSDLNLFKTVLQQVESDRNEKENLCHALHEEKVRIKKYKEMVKACENDIDHFRTRIDELKTELKENYELIEKYNVCSKKLLNSASLIKTALVTVEEYATIYERNADINHNKRIDEIENKTKIFENQLNEYQQSPEAIECKNLEKSLKKLKFESKYLNHEIESQKQIKESLENMKSTIRFVKSKKLYETLQMTYKHMEIDKKIQYLRSLYEKKLQETAIDYNANEIIPMDICSDKTNSDIPNELSQINSLELNIEESDFTKSYNPLSEIQLSSQQNTGLEQHNYLNEIYELYQDFFLSANIDNGNDKLKMTSSPIFEKSSNKKTRDYSDKENVQQNRKKICTEQSKNMKMMNKIDESNKIDQLSNDDLKDKKLKPKLISDQIIDLSLETDIFNLISLNDSEVDQGQQSITFEGNTFDNNVVDCNKAITDDQISDLTQSIDLSDMKDDDQESEISSLQSSMKSYEKPDNDFQFMNQETSVKNTRKTTEKTVGFNLFEKAPDGQSSTQSRSLAFFNKQSSDTNNVFNFMGPKQKQQTKKSFF